MKQGTYPLPPTNASALDQNQAAKQEDAVSSNRFLMGSGMNAPVSGYVSASQRMDQMGDSEEGDGDANISHGR